MRPAKSLKISKQAVWEAWLKVKRNGGSFGIDKQSIALFDEKLEQNLYKIWNRMSSGSYFPPPVLGIPIPKKAGGARLLGIPTVADRVAQMVIKDYLEPHLEPVFHHDSYGYRPQRSAIDAVSITRQRCWQYPWVVEFDIKGLFDNIDHELLLKALRHHCREKWVLLYVERWLKAPMQTVEGTFVARTKGTPQGGVVSPLLANLFMHYAFDMWVEREFKGVAFCRYADDGLLHCYTLRQAEYLLSRLKERMTEVGLEIHPEKSKIVYCKDVFRNAVFGTCTFEFLGYEFRPRKVRSKEGKTFTRFTPAVSTSSLKAMRKKMKSWQLHFRVSQTLEEIAELINPILRGWVNYYGHFRKSELRKVWYHLNWRLAKWIGIKYKKLRGRPTKAIHRLGAIAKQTPNLFVHWRLSCRPAAG